MGQFRKVLLAIDNAHTVQQRALDCRPGLGRLIQVMDPTIPLLCLEYICHVISTSLPDVQIGNSMIS